MKISKLPLKSSVEKLTMSSERSKRRIVHTKHSAPCNARKRVKNVIFTQKLDFLDFFSVFTRLSSVRMTMKLVSGGYLALVLNSMGLHSQVDTSSLRA